MKKRNKKTNARAIITTQNVGMERKKDVVLIKNNVDKMSEEDIKNLIKLI